MGNLKRVVYLESRGDKRIDGCTSSFLYLGGTHSDYSHLTGPDKLLLEMWERMTFGGVKV